MDNSVFKFNEKNDAKDAWGYSTSFMFTNYIHVDDSGYFHEKRGIEQQIDTLSEAIGNICDLLISKKLMTGNEFLEIIEKSSSHEMRIKDND